MNMNSMKGLQAQRMPDFSAMREKMFNKADTNGDQGISLEEFTNAGKKMPVGQNGSAEKAKNAFAKIDSDGNGSLSRDEVNAFTDKMSSQMQGMMLAMQSTQSNSGQKPDFDAMFGKIDGDQNGSISRAEFDKSGLSNPLAKLLGGDKQDAFAQIDTDGDGSLSKDETKAFAESLKERLEGERGRSGSSRDEYMQAMNAYTNGQRKGDLTDMLLQALDNGRNQANKQQKAQLNAGNGVSA
jgi:Ca2+-binding EF-hand superfamily protein